MKKNTFYTFVYADDFYKPYNKIVNPDELFYSRENTGIAEIEITQILLTDSGHYPDVCFEIKVLKCPEWFNKKWLESKPVYCEDIDLFDFLPELDYHIEYYNN